MNKLKSKLKNKKGFTLIEMLIVVAIIAILVALSLPVFNNALDKARQETDNSNLRAAKSVALSEYIAKDKTGTVIYYYTTDGTVVEKTGSVTSAPSNSVVGASDKSKHIEISITDGKIDSTSGWK